MRNFVLTGNSFFLNKNLKLKILKRDPELPYVLHGHDFFELVIITSGIGTHFTTEEEITIQSGTIFVIPPGTQHGYKNVNNVVLYNVLISPELIENYKSDLGEMKSFVNLFYPPKGTYTHYSLSQKQMSKIISLVEKIYSETETISKGKGNNTMSFACYLELLVTMCRFAENTFIEDLQLKEQLKDVFEYLANHKDSTVSNEVLMDIAHMSASTLNRYFKRATGLSPAEYHIHERINLACIYLHTTTFTMEEIAEKTGFTDANYFSRQFRKVMNMSPTQYKRNWNIWRNKQK